MPPSLYEGGLRSRLVVELAPTSEVPQATPGPAPRSVRRGPRAPSDVVFYDPASMGEVGDEDEDAVQVPQFSYNPNDYDDDEDDEHRASPLATAPRDGEASARRYGRRSSVEAGRRAVTKRQSDFGFQLEDAFEDFGDASFGVGQGDDTVGMDESMRQIEFGYDTPLSCG